MAIRGVPYEDLRPDLVDSGEMVLILEGHERVDDTVKLQEFAECMKASGRKVGYMPHHERNGSTTYRARLFVGPLPDCIYDFVGPTRDLSKAAGFLAYRGMLAENCYTSQSKPKRWEELLETVHEYKDKPGAPPHLILNEALIRREMGEPERAAAAAHHYLKTNEWGDGRAMALTLIADTYRAGNTFEMAFVYYAQASLVSPLPEAFLGMMYTGEFRDYADRVDSAWQAADARMDFWPWSVNDRFVNPAREAARAACVIHQNKRRGRRYLERAKEYASDEDLLGLEETLESLEHQVIRRRLIRVDEIEAFTLPDSVGAALVGAGHHVQREFRDYDFRLLFNLEKPPPPGRLTYFCPTEPLDTNVETIRALMRMQGIVALSDFQKKQLLRTFPFLPERHIKRVPLGFNAIPADKKDQLIVCGKGSDLGVAEDIFARVAREVPDVTMVGGSDGGGSSLPRAKVWLYTGTDERVPLAPVELLEAQSAGAVPVCVGAGAIPEYVIRGFFYKPPVTAEAFKVAASKRIIELLKDEGERLAVATAHQRELNALHWDEVIEDWAKLG